MNHPDSDLDRIIFGLIALTALVAGTGLAIWAVIYFFWNIT